VACEAVKRKRLSAQWLWPDWLEGLSEKVLTMLAGKPEESLKYGLGADASNPYTFFPLSPILVRTRGAPRVAVASLPALLRRKS
jgi:hypothetical protein